MWYIYIYIYIYTSNHFVQFNLHFKIEDWHCKSLSVRRKICYFKAVTICYYFSYVFWCCYVNFADVYIICYLCSIAMFFGNPTSFKIDCWLVSRRYIYTIIYLFCENGILREIFYGSLSWGKHMICIVCLSKICQSDVSNQWLYVWSLDYGYYRM